MLPAPPRPEEVRLLFEEVAAGRWAAARLNGMVMSKQAAESRWTGSRLCNGKEREWKLL